MSECKWEIGSWFFYLATTHLRQIYAELPVNVWTVLWAGWVAFLSMNNLTSSAFLFRVFFAEYMNITFTFVWSFLDLFIILISIAIAAKFQKINERLEFFKGRVSLWRIEEDERTWR
jgi:hypothetical protein